jgi:ribosomal protein S18 acetylase RimI-like enzyme
MQLIVSRELDVLLPPLRDAEEGDERITAAIMNLSYTPYIADVEGEIIGAAVMRWDANESELVYVAVAAEQRGRGLGKAIIEQLIQEGRRRGTRAILVGTANSSLENIAFYQKCGFRMESVRRDFFAYLPQPIYEHGIAMRDMLMLRYAV